MTRAKGQVQVDFLRSVIGAGGRIVKANCAIERDFDLSNPTYLLTLEQHGALSLQEFSWTPELEEFLLYKHPLAMETLDEESARFAIILGSNLQAVESQFGRDYARAIFVELIKEHPEYNLGRLLAKVPASAPSHDSDSYRDCRQLLDHAIAGLQNTAIVKLGHRNDQEAITLIANALGILLDDRFHISLRAHLFPD